jgi:hypothetical protein
MYIVKGRVPTVATHVGDCLTTCGWNIMWIRALVSLTPKVRRLSSSPHIHSCTPREPYTVPTRLSLSLLCTLFPAALSPPPQIFLFLCDSWAREKIGQKGGGLQGRGWGDGGFEKGWGIRGGGGGEKGAESSSVERLLRLSKYKLLKYSPAMRVPMYVQCCTYCTYIHMKISWINYTYALIFTNFITYKLSVIYCNIQVIFVKSIFSQKCSEGRQFLCLPTSNPYHPNCKKCGNYAYFLYRSA